MKLGETSSTGDPEGTTQKVSSIIPTKQSIEQTLNKFTGTLQQVPPIYSAIKINGQRSYILARQGKDIQMKAREVTVLSLRLISYAYPYATLSANVSPGTYIRTLAEDIGKSLGTGAYTTRLRRCEIGRFEISQARPVSGLSAEQIERSLVDL
jgi:tRNA pseudouridine55 synthase